MMFVQLKRLVQGFAAIANVRRKVISPGFAIENKRDCGVLRCVAGEFDEAGTIHRAGPFELFLFLNVGEGRKRGSFKV